MAFAFGNVFAQTRGAGNVKMKSADGKTREVKLYDGSFALVIGNSDYQSGWDELTGVKSDVKAIGKTLERQNFKVEIAENLNAQQFDERVKQFINDYGYAPKNRLLIYYAGHGHTLKSAGDGRELGYIVPVDAPNPQKDELGFRRKAVSMDTIQTYAKQIQSKHALFIFDSCFSGKLVSRGKITVPSFIRENVAFAVRQFITAGAANQVVPDESIFRRSLVIGLEGEADGNADGYITGTELAEYLKEKVSKYSNRRQTPQYGKINDVELDRGDFVFTVPAETDAPNIEQTIPVAPVLEKTPKAAATKAWANLREAARNSLKYDSINRFSDNLALVQKGNRRGYVDEMMREAITAKYEIASDFSEGLASVQINDKYGFIDKTGREVIAPKYLHVESFSEGLAAVQVDRKWGFIDKTGREIIPSKYGFSRGFSENLASVSLGGKTVFIDKTGRIVLKPK
ncbi:MAG: WG repeat-containing protein, partial [Pyrinomonadaceae bacterium]|nr:WG repeat-containing protein [Pyrinomonadaceae bacterium]